MRTPPILPVAFLFPVLAFALVPLGCTGTVDRIGGAGGSVAPGSGGRDAGVDASPGSGGLPAGSGGRGGSGGLGGMGGAGSGGKGGAAGLPGSGGIAGSGGSGSGGLMGSGGQGSGGSGSGGLTGSGGRGSGGSGSGGSGSGGSGSGGSTVSSCTNYKKDGSETGVDCGGSCPACPSYKINSPNANNTTQSACNGGPGYMCVRSMLFSTEMKQAAYDDWGAADPPFVYGVVGHDLDAGGVDGSYNNACCQCYQLVFESPADYSIAGLPTPRPMIVQAFNTAAGGGKNFDIYMAAGGYGANNACSAGNAMYSGYPDLGGNYTGGVRATRFSQCASGGAYSSTSIASATCQDYVKSQCTLIQSSSSAANQSSSQISCMESNFVESHYHMNWKVRAKRVECPTNLTRVTGCKLNNQNLPQPDPAVKTVSLADSTYKSGYTTTTMQDCCRPTCSWKTNVSNADPAWPLFYTCDRNGTPQ